MKYQLPNLLNVINGLAKNRGITLRSICISMNRQHNFLNSHLRTNDPRIDVLLELSDLLNVNLLEAYLPLLQPKVRPTALERDLIRQLAERTAELETVKAERDRLWGVVEKRMG